MNRDEQLDDLLHEDALLEAEKITGKSYKEDKATEKMGFLLHLALGQQKKAALKARNDSYWHQPYVEHLALIESLGGFELVFEEDYANDRGDVENMRAYGHREKAMFWCVNSYTSGYPEGAPPTVNHSSIDFCLRYAKVKDDEERRLPLSASWSPFSNLWDALGPCGRMHLDGREAILHKLRKIEESDWVFMVPWPQTHKTYFTHHYDTAHLMSAHEPDIPDAERRDRQKIHDTVIATATLRRVAQLPRWVRELCPFEPWHVEYVK